MHLETDILAELISRKRVCLAHLLQLGERQREMIAAGEMAGLLKVLGGKQRLLAELQTLERALDRFRDQDPDARVWRSPEARQRCAAEVADCETFLAAILQQERSSEDELRRRRDDAQQRLEAAHGSRQVLGAYLAESPDTLHQLDLASES
ncbi:MAG: flagellar protein FlgN [Pirellulales bacterium]|nr:flagellar protein FlgN [Pirellulales bacterium]